MSEDAKLKNGIEDDASKGGMRDKDAGLDGGPKFKNRRRRKVSHLTINKIDSIDYKDIALLRRFINDRGKILPSRQTGNTANQQRMVTRAINKAREMALLPFVVTEPGQERYVGGGRRSRDYGDRGPRAPRDYDRKERVEKTEAPSEAPAPAETSGE